MNGVLIAAAVVGILGIVIGVFLGVSGATVEAAVMRAVMHMLRLSSRAVHRLICVQAAVPVILR